MRPLSRLSVKFCRVCKETQKRTPPYRALGALQHFQCRLLAALRVPWPLLVSSTRLSYVISGRP
jgi:hypothetical protein